MVGDSHDKRPIFISYRRRVGAHSAELAFERLSKRLGDGLIFYDVEDIVPGEPFPQRLRDGLSNSEVVLAVIDPDWVDERYTTGARKGERRLDDPHDWVRIELETALAGKKLIPLLAMHASPLGREQLPPSLQDLADLQAQHLRSGPDGQHDFERLAQLLAHHLGITLRTASPPVFNGVPRRNPYFTGREQELSALAERLLQAGIAVINGLGGTGKTDTAAEYAYRQAAQYRVVLWVSADADHSILAGLARLAELLALLPKDNKDQNLAVEAARRWLASNEEWLLVFDNADTEQAIGLIARFLPGGCQGHVVITSRRANVSVLGVVHPITLSKLEPSDAVEFLRRRTGREEVCGRELASLTALAAELGYLPLALEQAAAYVLDRGVMFGDYLNSYQQGTSRVRSERLEKMPPQMGDREKRSVAVTWLLNFDEVKRKAPASAELLRFLAYLAPEDIPFELIARGASYVGKSIYEALTGKEDDPLALAELLVPLRRYSLIEIDDNRRTVSIHRLVQTVIRANLDADQERDLVLRAVNAVNAVLPPTDLCNWLLTQRLLPHAVKIAEAVISYDISTESASRLLNDTALYLKFQGEYPAAEVLMRRALRIAECILGPEHDNVAVDLNNLAALLHVLGNDAEAEILHVRSLAIGEKNLGDKHPSVAARLNNLAELYRAQGRFAEAEPLYLRALVIVRSCFGPDSIYVARTLNNLGLLRQATGRYADAADLLTESLAIRERTLTPGDPDIAQALSNLASVYNDLGRSDESTSLQLRALKSLEAFFGPDHPQVGTVAMNLGLAYRNEDRFADAEPLLRRAAEIIERYFGPHHIRLAQALSNLASVLRDQRKYVEAEHLYQRAVSIHNTCQEGSSNRYEVACVLNGLADLYRLQSRYDDAEPLFQRALAIREDVLGPKHPDVAQSLNNLAFLYHNKRDLAAAEPLYARAHAILRETLPGGHAHRRMVTLNYATLLSERGRHEEAAALEL